MKMRIIKVLFGLFIFLFGSFSFLCAQEKQQIKEQAEEYYQRGKELYAQGRYLEATAEFEKAMGLVSPARIESMEKVLKEQEKALAFKRLKEPHLPTGYTALRLAQSTRGLRVFNVKPIKSIPSDAKFDFLFKPTDYRIGIDDLLEVNVWKHPDLSKEVTVRPDGKISYLLIGDVQVAGLTVAQLVNVITKKFEAYAKILKEKEIIEGPPVRKEYRIGLGDVLDISVWKVSDFSVKAIVRPDGKISFPLLGDIQAYGKTFVELDDELTQRISAYVRDPQVSVMISAFGEAERGKVAFVTEFISTFLEEKPVISVLVKGFGSRKVIVLGQVNSPGIYDIKGNVRLLDAVAYAGDFTEVAVKDNIFLVRGDITTNPTLMKIDAWDIIKRGNASLNIPLQNQDIIYVPRSIIGNINVFWGAYGPTISKLSDSVTLKNAVKATFKWVSNKPPEKD